MAAVDAASAGSDDELVAGDDTDDGDLDDLLSELKECDTVDDLLEVVTDEAASMSPEEVSFALYRIAYMARSLSHKERQDVLDGDPVKALMSVVLQKHTDMNSAQACKCMWAMATLKADHNRPVVAALSQKWRTELVHQAPILDNTQFLWALGTLGSRSNDRVYADCLNDLLVTIRRQISESTREGLDIDRCVSMAATGAAKLRFRILGKATDPAARGAFIVELQRYLKTRMDKIGGRALANTLRALVDLGSAPPELLAASAEQMAKRPGDFTLQERCMIIGSCAAQRFHPGNIVGNVVNTALQDGSLSSASAGQLLLALARYGAAPPRSVIALVETVCPPPPDADAADASTEGGGDNSKRGATRPPSLDALVNAAWAAGVLKVGDAPSVTHLCAAAAAALDAAAAGPTGTAGIPDRILRKAFHAQMLLRHVGGDLPLSRGVAASAAAEWAAASWPQGHAELVQSRLIRFLEAMEVPFKANVAVADGLLRVDVQLEQSKGAGPAAVLLSGAKDYLTGPGVDGDWTPCGPKAREEDLLAAAGFRPVRVPASPVRHVPNMQFILYAEKVLKKAGVHKPDIPVSGIPAVMEVERMAQLAKQKKRQESQAGRGRQLGALELRDHYAALPDEEDERPLSTRRSPRRGGEAAPVGEEPLAQPSGGQEELDADTGRSGSGGDAWGGVGVSAQPAQVAKAVPGEEDASKDFIGDVDSLDSDEEEHSMRSTPSSFEMAGAGAAAAAAAAGVRASGRRVVTAARERREPVGARVGSPPADGGDSWGAVSGTGHQRPRGYGGAGGDDILGASGRSRGSAPQQRRMPAEDGDDEDVWSSAWQDEGAAEAREGGRGRGRGRGRGGRGGRSDQRGGRGYGRGGGRGAAW